MAVGLGVAVGPGDAVGLGVAVGPGVGVAVGPGVGVGIPVGRVMMLLSRVTAPFSARSLPSRVAPRCIVMLWFAMMLPTNTLSVPIVAELPTCQKMFTELPFRSEMEELGSTVNALPIRKWKGAFGSPPVLSVSVPLSCANVSNL